jgi:hypothetical protein
MPLAQGTGLAAAVEAIAAAVCLPCTPVGALQSGHSSRGTPVGALQQGHSSRGHSVLRGTALPATPLHSRRRRADQGPYNPLDNPPNPVPQSGAFLPPRWHKPAPCRGADAPPGPSAAARLPGWRKCADGCLCVSSERANIECAERQGPATWMPQISEFSKLWPARAA